MFKADWKKWQNNVSFDLRNLPLKYKYKSNTLSVWWNWFKSYSFNQIDKRQQHLGQLSIESIKVGNKYPEYD